MEVAEKSDILALPPEILEMILFKLSSKKGSSYELRKLMLVCHRFKDVFEGYLQFKSSFFTRIPRTNEEIQMHLNSQKRVVSLVISVEIDSIKLAALEKFWEAKGSSIKNVTIYNYSGTTRFQHLYNILFIIRSAENVEIQSFPEEFSFVRSEKDNSELQTKFRTINFNNLKSLTVHCGHTKYEVASLFLLKIIWANQLEKLEYVDKVARKDQKLEFLQKYKNLQDFTFQHQIKIKLKENYLKLRACFNYMTEVEEFFKNRFNLIKSVRFLNHSCIDISEYDSFFDQVKDHVTCLTTKGGEMKYLFKKFKFPNLKKIVVFHFFDFKQEIEQIAANLPNLEELNIANHEKSRLTDTELALIRLHFDNLKDLKQMDIDISKGELNAVPIREYLNFNCCH